jgi:hypothetical protein
VVNDAAASLLTPVQQAWMLGLLAAWFALLFGGFAFGKPDSRHGRRMPLTTRIASSGVLVAAAASWLVIALPTGAATFSTFVAMGMLLGFAGDLLMAGLRAGGVHVTGAMLAFGLGHVAYLLAFRTFAAGYPGRSPVWTNIIWLVWLLVGVVGWWQLAFVARGRRTLRWLALPYALVVTGMAAAATSLALQDRGFIVTAVGAALFVLSDTILAAVLFGKLHDGATHDIVWLTYGPAQMLIVYSVFVAIQVAT